MPASILVVDDESSVTGALDLLLRDHGYEVNTASTAAEADPCAARHGGAGALRKSAAIEDFLTPPERSTRK